MCDPLQNQLVQGQTERSRLLVLLLAGVVMMGWGNTNITLAVTDHRREVVAQRPGEGQKPMNQIFPDLTPPKQNFITPKQGEEAIQYLATHIEPTLLLTINDLMYAEEWPIQFHFGIGGLVRNTLCQKFEWDDLLLDAQWVGLIEAATNRYVEMLNDDQETQSA